MLWLPRNDFATSFCVNILLYLRMNGKLSLELWVGVSHEWCRSSGALWYEQPIIFLQGVILEKWVSIGFLFGFGAATFKTAGAAETMAQI